MVFLTRPWFFCCRLLTGILVYAAVNAVACTFQITKMVIVLKYVTKKDYDSGYVPYVYINLALQVFGLISILPLFKITKITHSSSRQFYVLPFLVWCIFASIYYALVIKAKEVPGSTRMDFNIFYMLSYLWNVLACFSYFQHLREWMESEENDHCGQDNSDLTHQQASKTCLLV